MNQVTKILFLTTSNLATNPRLVKEMDLAIQDGYHVSVICFSFKNWSTDLNSQIVERFGSSIELKEIAAGRMPPMPWLLSTFFQQLNKFFYLFAKDRLSFISFALLKRTWLLQKELKVRREPVDLIVGHNPGSFYPAYSYSKKMKIPFGIDVEDYHPGEINRIRNSSMLKKMMQAILPAAAYVTAASPLILKKIKEDCNEQLKDAETILNFFDQNEFLPPVNTHSDKVKIVWFSQYISSGRGLERFIETARLFHDQIELHLYGQLSEQFYQNHLRFVANVFVHPALPQEELHQQLAQYDIGLATENKSENLNRDICLTNKLLSYYQAGLYILASDTSAQKQFIQQFPFHGRITTLLNEDLKNAVQTLYEQRDELRQTSMKRFENAQSFNSAKELKKLSIIWKTILPTKTSG